MGYDVRGIANLVLDRAADAGLTISNMHINKIIFFVYVEWLKARGSILTSAKIEAWKHGPVFREVYSQFKKYGASPITEKARKVDFATGEWVDVELDVRVKKDDFLVRAVDYYIRVPAGRLVDLSHEPGGAWHYVWNHQGEFNVGMEITPDIIRAYQLKQGH
ncbi:Panacea domain-containing protein [Paracoccus sp. MC1862]|uniref:Panacea domain-containing protein n=1 Tax=Paracoccus sp. MC1862 TaxID=2760307 RepID=UPI001601EC45|nr:type II toxin-antitoxin system antitoxin SocA domain-containing protein [Paracoccus sp. MC1862]MBB1498498.1 DUF4065 domain-containing protein [Paracoccus sp. MC1862]QQO43846.1 DUF4065 domain-containing protein [Paracoccus sp. MC1862]